MRPDALEWAVRRLFAGDESARGQIRRLVAKAIAPEHPDGLARAKALAAPGCCIFCEEKLTGGRRWKCGEPDCKQAYQRAYHRDMRSARGQPARGAHAR